MNLPGVPSTPSNLPPHLLAPFFLTGIPPPLPDPLPFPESFTGPLSFSWHRGDSWAPLGTGPRLELRHVGDNDSGHYQCRASDGHSVAETWLVLQVPARALLEGDTVTLRCRSWQDNPVTWVSFFHEEKQLQSFRSGTELSLSPLRLHNSGRYRCRGLEDSVVSWGWKESESAPVTVTVPHSLSASPTGVPLSGVSVSAQPPGAQVVLGDRLVLSCAVAAGTGPLSFSWHRGDSWALLGTGPRLELRHAGDNDSGHYQCQASDGDSMAKSVPMNVTVLGEQDPQEWGDPTHNIPIPPGQVPAPSVFPQCPWPMPPSAPVPWHSRCAQVTP
uniref:Uncharacterized protein n=1 Tax=Corvus moneduloides TaxID=1196302 RepID=A0A8U7NWC5_CORMO